MGFESVWAESPKRPLGGKKMAKKAAKGAAAKKKRTISFGIDKCAVNCCRSPLPMTLNADAVSVQRTDG